MAPRTTWEKVKQEHVSFARAPTVQNQDHFGNVHCEQHFDWRSWNTGKEEGLSGCANPLCSMTRRNRAPLWVGIMACLHLQKQLHTCQQLLVEDPCGCSFRLRIYTHFDFRPTTSSSSTTWISLTYYYLLGWKHLNYQELQNFFKYSSAVLETQTQHCCAEHLDLKWSAEKYISWNDYITKSGFDHCY